MVSHMEGRKAGEKSGEGYVIHCAELAPEHLETGKLEFVGALLGNGLAAVLGSSNPTTPEEQDVYLRASKNLLLHIGYLDTRYAQDIVKITGLNIFLGMLRNMILMQAWEPARAWYEKGAKRFGFTGLPAESSQNKA